jgi:F-type H+-transporting ATPase subunit c
MNTKKGNFMNKRNALVAVTTVLAAGSAFAQEATTAATHAAGISDLGLKAVAVGVGLGLAGLGAALGQGRAASSALEGIARNPAAADKIQTPLILSLAFMEAIALYGLALAFVL